LPFNLFHGAFLSEIAALLDTYPRRWGRHPHAHYSACQASIRQSQVTISSFFATNPETVRWAWKSERGFYRIGHRSWNLAMFIGIGLNFLLRSFDVSYFAIKSWDDDCGMPLLVVEVIARPMRAFKTPF
jgi:hypothetical protein